MLLHVDEIGDTGDNNGDNGDVGTTAAPASSISQNDAASTVAVLLRRLKTAERPRKQTLATVAVTGRESAA